MGEEARHHAGEHEREGTGRVTRSVRVLLRGLLHVAWTVGTALLIAWVGPGPMNQESLMLALVCVLVAHSAWRAAESETPC